MRRGWGHLLRLFLFFPHCKCKTLTFWQRQLLSYLQGGLSLEKPCKKCKHSTNEVTLISYLIGDSKRVWPTSIPIPPQLRYGTTLGDKEPGKCQPTVISTRWVHAQSHKMMESVLGCAFFFFLFFFFADGKWWCRGSGLEVKFQSKLFVLEWCKNKTKQPTAGRLTTGWSL